MHKEKKNTGIESEPLGGVLEKQELPCKHTRLLVQHRQQGNFLFLGRRNTT